MYAEVVPVVNRRSPLRRQASEATEMGIVNRGLHIVKPTLQYGQASEAIQRGCSAARMLLWSALDLGAEVGQTFVDSLVSTLDLVGVADPALASGAERRDQHRHSGTNVGALHPAPP